MAATWTMFGRQQMLLAYLTTGYLTSLQVALTRVVPVANASASQLVEPVTGSYARVGYGTTSAYWTPTGFGELTNAASVVFPTVTDSWGLVNGWALVDPTSGQCITVGSLKEPFIAEPGMTPTIAPGVLVLGNYD